MSRDHCLSQKMRQNLWIRKLYKLLEYQVILWYQRVVTLFDDGAILDKKFLRSAITSSFFIVAWGLKAQNDQ